MNRKTNQISLVNEYLNKNKSKFNKEIGETIKEKKREMNMTNKILSDRSNISQLYLSQIEDGKYNISLLKFITICNSLEVYPNEILEEFLLGCKENEDRFFYISKKNKNMSRNLIDYIKENIKCDYKFFKVEF